MKTPPWASGFRNMYVHMERWYVCCVQVERRGGFWVEKVVLGDGSVGGRGVTYSLFTRKERIKIYKETPLSFPKTQNSDPLVRST